MTLQKLNLVLAVLVAGSAFARVVPNRYTLILEDPPVAERFASREARETAEAKRYQQQIEAKQKTLAEELKKRHIEVTGSVATVMNAIFVIAPPERLDELKKLPGVKRVMPGRRYKMLSKQSP